MASYRQRGNLKQAQQKFGWGGINTFRLEEILQSAGKRVLDIGCARGDYVNYLHRLGYDICGIDLLVSAAWCESDAAGRFVVGDIHNLPIENGRFDTTILFNVLEHIGNVERALAEISRVLRPQGNLLLVVPNCEDAEVFYLANLHFYHWTDLSHLHAFTSESIEATLVSTGFTVTKIEKHERIRPEILLLDMWHIPLTISKQISRVLQRLPCQKRYSPSLLVVASKS